MRALKGTSQTEVVLNHSCVARSLRYTPLPSTIDSVSGGDNGRERLIRAQSRLGWLGDSSGLAERFEGN